MFKDQIIELDAGISYYVIEELVKDGKTYVLLSLVNLDKDIIDEDNLVLKEIVETDAGYETKDVEDDTLATEITKDLIIKNKGTN